jgi:hypothetical protein
MLEGVMTVDEAERVKMPNARQTDWMLCFLQHRYTTLVVGSHSQPRSPVDTGIPQGSPLSLILYLFYNANLVE